MKYRRDIDGIRALAVLAIFAFHLGLRAVPGGFVGVDIFFVISGYLIGGIVVGGIKEGSFSLTDFYVRRCRRILPALTFVLLVVSAGALFVLLPSDLVAYGKSLIASALSVANIHFWKGAGYFDHSAIEKPLLHIWSLGVEEQFYLFFPLSVLLLYRLRASLIVPGLTVLGLASFALSVYMTTARPTAGFYLLPGRGWEMVVGVVLAATPIGWLKHTYQRNLLAIAGLVAMLIAIFGYKAGTPFPGVAAALPCLGAAAVIAAGRDGTNIVKSLLSTPPLVFIGLISFSLYLWHWPVIVLFQYFVPSTDLSHVQQLGIFAAGVILASLSWWFVEQPFRKVRKPAPVIFRYSGLAVAAVSLIGVAMIVSRGFPSRYSPAMVKLAGFLDYEPDQQFREHHCFLRNGDPLEQLSLGGCLKLDSSRANVLLVGNSHAAHLWQGLSQADGRVNVMQATSSGWNCIPVIYKNASGDDRCARLFNYIYDDFLKTNKVDLLIMSATWEEADMAPLRQTLAEAKARSIPVLLIGPGTQYAMPLPRLLALAYKRKNSSLPAKFEETSPLRFDGELRQAASEQGADFSSLHELLCHDGCVTLVNGTPLLFDTDHLTPAGSSLAASRLRDSPAWKKMISRFEQAHPKPS